MGIVLDLARPSPWLIDYSVQRLRQLVRGHLVEVQVDGGPAAAQMGQVRGLVYEQRDSNHWHSVIDCLIKAVGATMRHKCSRLRVT